ncbi:helix-turn-helix transcriptional regulator [Streptomyces sp. NPDC052236]|uniref:helix-turn-helix transcriptional regulator n=1 Tax=Streptomyces sp. NPDC052236 TaxID=3365686 RepID=UPI0037D50937
MAAAVDETAQTVLRRELGSFLRAHRERLTPSDVGLPSTPRRRTSGLRREEVAALSGVSVAWYTWVEQGRVDTSRQVLDAVARALRMDSTARRHALALAGFVTEPPEAGTDVSFDPAFRTMLDSWPDSPALLLDSTLDILAWNTAYTAVWPDPTALPPERRNLLMLLIGDARHQRLLPDWQPVFMDLYRHFRTRADQQPPAARSRQLTARMRTERPDLEAWWACRSVGDFTSRTIELLPQAGPPRTYSMTLLLTSEPQGGAVLVQTPT